MSQTVITACTVFLNAEVSFYIYDRPLTGINVIVGFCAYRCIICGQYFNICCLKQWFLKQTETEASFIYIVIGYNSIR